MIRKFIAGASTCVIIGAILWASVTPTPKAPSRNGDQVGMIASESFPDYAARARASVNVASGESFALVTLAQPGDVATVNRLQVRRVSAAVFGERPPVLLPEPVGGVSRADVLRRVAADSGGVTGVIVYDDAEQLRSLANTQGVVAVEALPSDAVWGKFGIRPVRVS